MLEAAQLELRHGVTTVRDSYGLLLPLVAVRDDIAAGRAVGARILAAGNIIGWGGPYSVSFSLIKELGLTLFQEQVNDDVSQGVGEELVDMSPEELMLTIRAYLDKGADFLKYGGTAHFARPSFIGFSPEAQKVIVDEAHARGKVAETHATTIDGLRLSIAAGIDLIQHPGAPRRARADAVAGEGHRGQEDRLLDAGQHHHRRGVDQAPQGRRAAAKKRAEAEKNEADVPAPGPRPPPSCGNGRRKTAWNCEMRRKNAQTLIKAGAVVTPGTDSYWAAAPEFSRTPKPRTQDHGIGTVLAIEGLVELGMTPAQAIVAGTKNGAIASRGLAEFGTVEPGKRADLLVLDASPLDDIKNLRKISTVMKDGAVIDRESLPSVRVLSRPGQ